MADCVDNSTVLTEDMIHPENDPDKIQLESLTELQKPSLEPPLRDSAPTSAILGSPSKTRPASVVSVKNTRKRMEDRHVVLHDLKAYLPSSLQSKINSEEHVSYYAVFDGHAGTDAATYAAAHLHEMLVDSTNYPDNPGEAFTDAFLICDEKFVSSSKKSGTTAVCCLVKDDKIFVSWLGDSQAVLVRNGQTIKIVDPHKPNREDEKERIEKLGGSVIHWGTWRVNGQLAVSRAIGDGEYKPYISAQSDVTTINMNGTEDFIIIACDGLWDTISFEEATELTYQFLSDHNNDLENLSVHLSTVAKDKGSTDNITIIVIFLKPVDKVRNTKTEVSQCGDVSGISSSSQYVLIGGGGRDSIDQMRVPSPGLNFASPDGGGMFSPFDHQGAQNGFDLSNENFDTRLSDEQNKRFSEINVANMDDLMKQKSIDKVNDLLAVLNCEDTSPNPEDEEDIPLEEILATARGRTEDDIDGVENMESSEDDSDDEVVELRRKPSDDSVKFNAILDHVMDPCEQVTVVATGPDECGTVVPPSKEMPVHQQPESVDLAPSPGIMSCSMVQEENGVLEGSVSIDKNGEKGDGNGFMLNTNGDGEEQLSEFSHVKGYHDDGAVHKEIGASKEDVNKEHTEVLVEMPDVFVSTAEETLNFVVEESELDDIVDDSYETSNTQEIDLHDNNSSSQESSSGLDVPSLQVTPATPVRSLTPVDMEIVASNDTEVEDELSEQLAGTEIDNKEVDNINYSDVDEKSEILINGVISDIDETGVVPSPNITTAPATSASKKPTNNDEDNGFKNGVKKEKKSDIIELEDEPSKQMDVTEIDNDKVENKENPDVDKNETEKSVIPTNGVVPNIEESAAVSVPTITPTAATPTPKKPTNTKQTTNKLTNAEASVTNKPSSISKRLTDTKPSGLSSAVKQSSSGGTTKSTASTKIGATKKPVGTKLNGVTSGQVPAKRTATSTSNDKSQLGASNNPTKRAPLTKPTTLKNERPKVSETGRVPTPPKTTTNSRPSTTSAVGRSTAGVVKSASTRPTVARATSNASSTTGAKRPVAPGLTRPTTSGSSTGSSRPATGGSSIGSTRPSGGPTTGSTKLAGSNRPTSGPGSRPAPNKISVGPTGSGTNRTTASKTLPTTKVSTTISRATTTKPTTTKPSITTTRSTTSTKTSATSSTAGGTRGTFTTASGTRGTATSTTAGKQTTAASRVASARASPKEVSKQGKQIGKIDIKAKKDPELVKNEANNENFNEESTVDSFKIVQSSVDDIVCEGKEILETKIEEPSTTGDEMPSGSGEETIGENSCALIEKESEC